MIYDYLVSEVQELSKHIEMFHSEMTKEEKEKIIHQLTQKGDTVLRIFVATSALGMGVNVDECISVIMYEILSTLVDLLQEYCHIGPNGKDSVAVILHNSYHNQHVDMTTKGEGGTTKGQGVWF